MKAKHLFALIAGAGLAWTACRQADPGEAQRPMTFAEIAVSLSREDGTEDTRSTVDIAVEKFQKAALFAFDAETGFLLCGDAPVAAFSDRQNFSWSLPVGRKMDIYTLVNYGDLDMASFAREGLHKSELESLLFTSRGPSELKELETSGRGMPMSGIRKGVVLSAANQSLSLTVKKLYAKYNLYFDLSRPEAQGWHVQAMHMVVENANTEVPYFGEGFRQDDPAKLVEYDRATEKDLDDLQRGDPGCAVTLYMLENCQGTKEGAQSWKTVYKDLGFEAVRNCTYIDLSVKVQRANGEYQDLGYAIYLGKTDMRSDFDIERNLFKTVRIVLPGPDDLQPASRFFKFSGTESPTVTPGESIDLYFVTNLEEGDISASCDPGGRLTVQRIEYRADEQGIADGFVRLLAGTDLQEGDVCVVTAGSERKDATDQRTVTAAWPTVLEVSLDDAPAYVAQTGWLAVTPGAGIIRVDADVLPDSAGILEVREAGTAGSTMHIGLAALSAGTGTVVLHGYNSANVEIVTQEVEVPVLAPRACFSMDTYTLLPDGTVQKGMLIYRKADGSSFYTADLERFDATLVKKLLFPTDWMWVQGCDAFVDARFTRDSEEDRRMLTVPIQMRVTRLSSSYGALEWEDGKPIGSMSYSGAPSANLPLAEADLAITSPFAGTAGTCLAVVENILPLHEVLSAEKDYLNALRITPEFYLGITSYRNGKTFSANESGLSLELELPIGNEVTATVEGPEEFTIECRGKTLVLTAKDHPAAYTGYGRRTLYARIRHTETGEYTDPVEMGYLELYLIGAVGPYIHGTGPYEVGGCVIPDGDRSPIHALSVPAFLIGENIVYTTSCLQQHGLYATDVTSAHHLYHQYVEIDEHGVDRYAEDGETSYLNSYLIRTGNVPLDTDLMEFNFGSIFRGMNCGIIDAALECDRMVNLAQSGTLPKERLIHFPRAAEKDAGGYSYCAVVNLFGGNGGPVYDVFLELKGR